MTQKEALTIVRGIRDRAKAKAKAPFVRREYGDMNSIGADWMNGIRRENHERDKEKAAKEAEALTLLLLHR